MKWPQIAVVVICSVILILSFIFDVNEKNGSHKKINFRKDLIETLILFIFLYFSGF